MAGHLRPGLLRDRADVHRRPPARPGPVRHGTGLQHAAAGRPDDRGGPGQPEDGAGAAADLRPDGRPQVGHLDGGVRLQRRHVQQLRHRPRRRSPGPGRHLPARLPAPPGDAARLDRQAARQDPEHEAGRQPGAGDRGAGAGQAAPAAADGQPSPAGPGGTRTGGAGGPRAGGPRVTGENPRGGSPPGGAAGENLPEPEAVAGQERLAEQVARTGMFGTETTGDTSGYGGLLVRRPPVPASERPYGSYFDEIADRLAEGMDREGTGFSEAIEQVVVAYGELTMHVRREHLTAVAKVLRDEPSLAFEMCLGVKIGRAHV